MKKRYWFSCIETELNLNDYIGNLRGARSCALKYTKEYGYDIYINCGEDIIECVFA